MNSLSQTNSAAHLYMENKCFLKCIAEVHETLTNFSEWWINKFSCQQYLYFRDEEAGSLIEYFVQIEL